MEVKRGDTPYAGARSRKLVRSRACFHRRKINSARAKGSAMGEGGGGRGCKATKRTGRYGPLSLSLSLSRSIRRFARPLIKLIAPANVISVSRIRSRDCPIGRNRIHRAGAVR